MEHVERVLALAYRKLERLTLDPVARAAVELACDLGAWLGHLAVLPGRVIATH
jgi:hypothetical protein